MSTAVFAWGWGKHGQLALERGSYASSTGDVDCNNAPSQCLSIGGSEVVDISVGLYHSVFLTAEGKVFTAGDADATLGAQTAVRQVGGAIAGIKVTTIVSGHQHILALTDNGSVYSWGSNVHGQLGTGDVEEHSTPTLIEALNGQEVVFIAAGAHHSAALTSNGDLYTWGSGGNYQLGHGTTTDQVIPRRVQGLGMARIVQVACGTHHTMSLTEDGEVFSWGLGKLGRLGHGNLMNRPRPTRVDTLKHVEIKSIAAGTDFSLALSSQGILYVWGSNESHQLGLEEMVVVSVPTTPPSLKGATPIRDMSGGAHHTVVIAESGLVYTAGSTDHGRLGLGGDDPSGDVQTFVQVPFPSRFKSAVKVSAGYAHTVCLVELNEGVAVSPNQPPALDQTPNSLRRKSAPLTPTPGRVRGLERVARDKHHNRHSPSASTRKRSASAHKPRTSTPLKNQPVSQPIIPPGSAGAIGANASPSDSVKSTGNSISEMASARERLTPTQRAAQRAVDHTDTAPGSPPPAQPRGSARKHGGVGSSGRPSRRQSLMRSESAGVASPVIKEQRNDIDLVCAVMKLTAQDTRESIAALDGTLRKLEDDHVSADDERRLCSTAQQQLNTLSTNVRLLRGHLTEIDQLDQTVNRAAAKVAKSSSGDSSSRKLVFDSEGGPGTPLRPELREALSAPDNRLIDEMKSGLVESREEVASIFESSSAHETRLRTRLEAILSRGHPSMDQQPPATEQPPVPVAAAAPTMSAESIPQSAVNDSTASAVRVEWLEQRLDDATRQLALKEKQIESMEGSVASASFLQGKVTEMEHMKSSATTQLDSMSQLVKSLQAELTSKSDALSALTDKFDVTDAKLKASEKENVRLQMVLGQSESATKAYLANEQLLFNLRSEFDAVKAKNESLQNQLTTVQGRLRESEGERADTASELDNAVKHSSNLQAELSQAQSTVARLEEEVARLSSRAEAGDEASSTLNQVQTNLNQSTAQLEEVSVNFAQSEKARTDAEAELKVLQEEVERLRNAQTDYATLSQQYEARTEELRALATENTVLAAQLDTRSTELTRVYEERTAAQGERDEAKSELVGLEQLRRDHEHVQSKCDAQATRIHELEALSAQHQADAARYDEIEGKLREANVQLGEARGTIEHLDGALDEKNKQVLKLMDRLNTTVGDLEQTAEDTEGLKVRNEWLNGRVDEYETLVERVQRDLTTAIAEQQSLQDQLKTLGEEATSLRADNQRVTERNDELTRSLDTAGNQLSEARAQIDDYTDLESRERVQRAKIAELEADSAQQRSELNEIARKMSAASISHGSLKEEIDELQSKLASQTAQSSAQDDIIDELRDKSQRLETELHQRGIKLSSVKEANVSLSADLEEARNHVEKLTAQVEELTGAKEEADSYRNLVQEAERATLTMTQENSEAANEITLLRHQLSERNNKVSQLQEQLTQQVQASSELRDALAEFKMHGPVWRAMRLLDADQSGDVVLGSVESSHVHFGETPSERVAMSLAAPVTGPAGASTGLKGKMSVGAGAKTPISTLASSTQPIKHQPVQSRPNLTVEVASAVDETASVHADDVVRELFSHEQSAGGGVLPGLRFKPQTLEIDSPSAALPSSKLLDQLRAVAYVYATVETSSEFTYVESCCIALLEELRQTRRALASSPTKPSSANMPGHSSSPKRRSVGPIASSPSPRSPASTSRPDNALSAAALTEASARLRGLEEMLASEAQEKRELSETIETVTQRLEVALADRDKLRVALGKSEELLTHRSAELEVEKQSKNDLITKLSSAQNSDGLRTEMSSIKELVAKALTPANGNSAASSPMAGANPMSDEQTGTDGKQGSLQRASSGGEAFAVNTSGGEDASILHNEVNWLRRKVESLSVEVSAKKKDLATKDETIKRLTGEMSYLSQVEFPTTDLVELANSPLSSGKQSRRAQRSDTVSGADVETLRARVTSLREDLADRENQVESLSSTVRKLKQGLAQSAEQYTEALKTLQSKSDELDDATSTIEALQYEQQRLRDELETRRQGTTGASKNTNGPTNASDRAGDSQELSDLRAQLSMRKKQLADLADVLSATRAEKNALSNQLSSVMAKGGAGANDTSNNVTSAGVDNTLAMSDLTQLQTSLDEERQANKNLLEQIGPLQDLVQVMEQERVTERENAAAELDAIKQLLSTRTHELEEVRSLLKTEALHRTLPADTVDAVMSPGSNPAATIQRLRNRLEEVYEELSHAERGRQLAQSQLQEHKRKFLRGIDTMAKVMVDREAMQKALAMLRSKVKSLEAERDSLAQELAEERQLRQDAENLARERHVEFDDRLNRSEEQIRGLLDDDASMNNLSMERDQLAALVEGLNSELLKARAEIIDQHRHPDNDDSLAVDESIVSGRGEHAVSPSRHAGRYAQVTALSEKAAAADQKSGSSPVRASPQRVRSHTASTASKQRRRAPTGSAGESPGRWKR